MSIVLSPEAKVALTKQRRVYKFFQDLCKAEESQDYYLGALFSAHPVLKELASRLDGLEKIRDAPQITYKLTYHLSDSNFKKEVDDTEIAAELAQLEQFNADEKVKLPNEITDDNYFDLVNFLDGFLAQIAGKIEGLPAVGED